MLFRSFWKDRFHEALEAWRAQGLLDENLASATDDPNATANFDPNDKLIVYPDETPKDSLLKAATLVEEHLLSLSR